MELVPEDSGEGEGEEGWQGGLLGGELCLPYHPRDVRVAVLEGGCRYHGQVARVGHPRVRLGQLSAGSPQREREERW